MVMPTGGVGLDVGEVTRKISDRGSERGVRGLKRSWRRHWQLYLLILIPLAYFIIFKYIPMANTVIAFKDYNVVDGRLGQRLGRAEALRALLQQPDLLAGAAQHLPALGIRRARELPSAASSWRSH